MAESLEQQANWKPTNGFPNDGMNNLYDSSLTWKGFKGKQKEAMERERKMEEGLDRPTSSKKKQRPPQQQKRINLIVQIKSKDN